MAYSTITMNSVPSNPTPSLTTASIPPLTSSQIQALSHVNTIGSGAMASGYGAIPSTNITIGNVSAAGGTYSLSGMGISGTSPTISVGSWDNSHKSLVVKGDAEFEGDVKINGKSFIETLDRIEKQLAIFRPNDELESRWEELRDLATRYRELEAELKDKEKMWEILKR